ncbi:hypothetical protein BV20DRAFT_1033072 [Pilatotrama ljubarskyi]|nr:hypothetical protein BV20DRAFT_1033072 [Pilatotrama ljubarskyi]
MFERMPEHPYVMRNPFIVLRFVLFAILVYVNLLTVGFAVWNLSELKSLQGQALGAPTFVVFNACVVLTLLVGCLVTAWYSLAAFDRVRNECVWTGLVSALQLASSIDITVNGPPALCQGVSITACASSSLTVALSWISSTILLLYSFSLFTTAVTHTPVIPDVWASSVRAVPWFVVPGDCVESRLPPVSKPRSSSADADVLDIKRSSFHFPTPIFAQHAKALPLSPKSLPQSPTTPPIWQARRSSVPTLPGADDALPPSSSKRTTWTNRVFSTSGASSTLGSKRSTESLRPSWAKRVAPGRRGVDHPFAMPRRQTPPRPLVLPTVRPLRTLKLKSCWSPSTASSRSHTAPAVPPKARVAGAGQGVKEGAPQLPGAALALSPTGTFYIDLERDAVVPVGGTPAARPLSYEMFPEDVVDPDMPITRSQPSTWVRAHSPASSR